MATTDTTSSPAIRRQHFFIGGRWTESDATRSLEVRDPGTQEPIARVPLATAGDTRRAIEAAQAAFPAWAATPPQRRTEILFRVQALMLENMAGLAATVSREHGKVISDARGSVRRAIDMVEFACGIPSLAQGRTVENVGAGIDCASWRVPIGVCAAITPFNFPIMVPMWFAPIALACGNTFVLKPSEKTPLTSFEVARLFQQAGLPDGVLNVISGDREAAEVLLTDERVRAVSFVGSTPVARSVHQAAAHHGKRVQALGGAKNHLVAMPDADVEKTVAALIGAAFGSAGERCMAISVCVAVGVAADRLVDRLTEAARALRVGPSLDERSEMGPLVTREHRDRVRGLIDRGEAEDATLRLDGRGLTVPGHPEGNWLGPTIFDNVRPEMTIYREEIFGPVLCVVRVKTLDAAIELVNANPYGNGTSIFTGSGHAAREFRNRVQVGMIGVNVPIPVPMAFFAFTGWKDSFFGSLHAHGPDGVAFFTEQKVVTTRWFDDAEETRHNMSI